MSIEEKLNRLRGKAMTSGFTGSHFKMYHGLRQDVEAITDQILPEVKELEEAFNIAYDLLCDMHFNLTQPITQGSGHIKTVIAELEKVAKTNKLFIAKKEEE
ncbi:MAG: hypothetical protein V3U78_05410 [Thiotrichaceae bacterium]